MTDSENVTEVVPFLHVSDMERSLHYWIDGLGFTMKHQWIVDGKVRWCWLTRGGASVMLQQFAKIGFSLNFSCEDALAFYREVTARGIEASEPQVGNRLWDTELADPDGFRLHFASPTDVPEETKLSEVK